MVNYWEGVKALLSVLRSAQSKDKYSARWSAPTTERPLGAMTVLMKVVQMALMKAPMKELASARVMDAMMAPATEQASEVAREFDLAQAKARRLEIAKALMSVLVMAPTKVVAMEFDWAAETVSLMARWLEFLSVPN